MPQCGKELTRTEPAGETVDVEPMKSARQTDEVVSPAGEKLSPKVTEGVSARRCLDSGRGCENKRLFTDELRKRGLVREGVTYKGISYRYGIAGYSLTNE